MILGWGFGDLGGFSARLTTCWTLQEELETVGNVHFHLSINVGYPGPIPLSNLSLSMPLTRSSLTECSLAC